MIRIKIRLNSRQAEAKLLRFKGGTKFDVLTSMVAKKLGVVKKEEDETDDLPSKFKLYLGGEALVEDTSEIDNGDELVLKVVGEGETQEVKPEVEEEPEGEAPKEEGSVTETEEKENAVVDPYAYISMRTAKHFSVEDKDGEDEMVLFFGRVRDYFPSAADENDGEWEIQYDDNELEYCDLKDFEVLDMCLRRAKENKHLDPKKSKPKSKKKSIDDDDDNSSIEDVTEDVLRNRQKQKEGDAISIEGSDDDGDDDDEDYESDVIDDEDYESDADDLSYTDDYSDDGDKKRKAKGSPGKRSKRAHKPKDPPLEVLMNNKDVPAAPGKRTDQDDADDHNDQSGMQEMSTISSSGSAGADQDVKNRIIKLLNTGFHDKSNEHEAKNAMKLAQRLMRKHNLSQAVLLKEREAKGGGDEEVLKGGMVEVKIVNRKTRKPSQFARWLSMLMQPVSKNFDVESYYCVSRGRRCSVTFYGIYTNCQLAGYAFRVAAERISQMTAEHKPTQHCWCRITTKSSRLSYALGIVNGIDKEVDATIEREKERRQRKLERARQAISTGEAYEESDDEDGDGPGFSFPNNPFVSASLSSNEGEDASNADGQESGGEGESDKNRPAASPARATTSTSTAPSLSRDALDRRLREMEDEEENALVLVNHREKVAKEVLEEHNIMVRNSSKRKPITFDRASFDKGIIDSKEIDINQRAIRDEVKVKKEE